MSHHTHQTAPTQFLEANGIRFAYRRFGNAAGIPLVFNQHYLGTMDYWHPTVTDGLARDGEVILRSLIMIMNSPVVLVTGALTGIGRAMALVFAKTGARVAVSGR